MPFAVSSRLNSKSSLITKIRKQLITRVNVALQQPVNAALQYFLRKQSLDLPVFSWEWQTVIKNHNLLL